MWSNCLFIVLLHFLVTYQLFALMAVTVHRLSFLNTSSLTLYFSRGLSVRVLVNSLLTLPLVFFDSSTCNSWPALHTASLFQSLLSSRFTYCIFFPEVYHLELWSHCTLIVLSCFYDALLYLSFIFPFLLIRSSLDLPSLLSALSPKGFSVRAVAMSWSLTVGFSRGETCAASNSCLRPRCLAEQGKEKF